MLHGNLYVYAGKLQITNWRAFKFWWRQDLQQAGPYCKVLTTTYRSQVMTGMGNSAQISRMNAMLEHLQTPVCTMFVRLLIGPLIEPFHVARAHVVYVPGTALSSAIMLRRWQHRVHPIFGKLNDRISEVQALKMHPHCMPKHTAFCIVYPRE